LGKFTVVGAARTHFIIHRLDFGHNIHVTERVYEGPWTSLVVKRRDLLGDYPLYKGTTLLVLCCVIYRLRYIDI